jgi:hypothetical protein
MRTRRRFSAEFKAKVALEEAIARYGRPDIFNTDQGSQFTSFAFTTTLKDAGIHVSMDGRGRWMDGVNNPESTLAKPPFCPGNRDHLKRRL